MPEPNLADEPTPDLVQETGKDGGSPPASPMVSMGVESEVVEVRGQRQVDESSIPKEVPVHRVIVIAVVFLGLVSASVSRAAAGAPAADEKAVIEKVIRDNIGWALTKDRSLAESTMAHDERFFIFNPTSESTIGWSQLVKNFDFWMDPRFKALKCEIWDLRIDVSRSRDVAWWSGLLNDLGEWDGKATGWKDTRWTGVMEKRDGKWLIVQMHFSFAADKVTAQVRANMAAEKEGSARR
jgi:hypothetical protein